MLKYILKRVAFMALTFVIIATMCFVLVRMLPTGLDIPMTGNQANVEIARREALGYNKPYFEQFGSYILRAFGEGDLGTSWKIDYMVNVEDVIASRLPPTVMINAYSLIFSIPIGIGMGIYAALRKNRWQDHAASTLAILFISVPSYVFAFLLQYFLGYKLGWLPIILSSLYDAGGTWFSGAMFRSMIMPILALSFYDIASLMRYTRAELTEALTSDYMLLARTKGLTRSQATVRHALKNAMVPILPSIISMFVAILSGAMIIEQIFAVNGIGYLMIQSIRLRDYDVFFATSMFYTIIGLSSGILIDLSYGFLDPRIRMGAR